MKAKLRNHLLPSVFGGVPKMCIDCGYKGSTKYYTRGYLLLEIVLWCFFLIPGFIYTIWRQASKYEACSLCKCKTWEI